jgi:hypothetical protein
MKSMKSFKKGTSLESVGHFGKTAADELTGDTGSPVLAKNIRITIEVVGDDLVIDAVLDTFGLTPAKDSVEKFLDFRRDELRKPIVSITALRRLLKPFRGKPGIVEAAVKESIRQGWRGLFEGIGSGKPPADRAFGQEGGSDGGTW